LFVIIQCSLLGMQIEFNRMRTPLNTTPIIGYYYALHHQNKWHRIVVENIYFDNSIECFLIDTGKSIIVNQHQIYSLDPKFVQISSQVIKY